MKVIQRVVLIWFLVALVGAVALPIATPGVSAAPPIGNITEIAPAQTSPFNNTDFPCSGSSSGAGFGGLGGGNIIVGKLAPDGEYILITVPQIAGESGFTDCSLIFGNSIDIYDVSPLDYNSTATVLYEELSPSNLSLVVSSQTQSFSIAGRAVTEFTFTIDSTLQQRPFVLQIDGVEFVGYHLTPLTLLPNSVLTVGGLDLLVLLIVVEAGLIFGPLLLVAKALSRKAIFAPHFRLALWAPIAGFLMFFAILTDYRLIDESFGGVSYLVYPAIFAVLMFLWSLHLFNRAEVVEVLKADPAGGHRLRYLRWTLLVGVRKDGSLVVIDPRWRGWLYALFGHFVTLVPAQSEALGENEPAAAEIENRVLLPQHVIQRRLQRELPSKERPTDDFVILNAEKYEEPTRLFWVDTDQPFEIRYCYLSAHREVEVPPKLSPEGEVLVPASTRLKLSWPHIVTPPCDVRLAGIHYWTTPVAAQGWMGAESTNALLEKRTYQVTILRSRLHTEADRMAEERVAEIMTMIDKARAPPTEAELADEVERIDLTRRHGGDSLLDRLMGLRKERQEDQPVVRPPTATSFKTRKPKKG